MLLIEQLIPTGFSIRRLTKNILITITPLFSSNISNMQKNRRAVTKTNLTPQNKAIKAEPFFDLQSNLVLLLFLNANISKYRVELRQYR